MAGQYVSLNNKAYPEKEKKKKSIKLHIVICAKDMKLAGILAWTEVASAQVYVLKLNLVQIRI